MPTGNKGEWSEFYTFIKLLVDKKLVSANKDLEKIENIFYPIIKIIREEAGKKSEYILQGENEVEILQNDTATIVDISDLKSKIVDIFTTIKESGKTFTVPEADELLARFKTSSLNASNSKKEDLVLKIHDHNIGSDQDVGFSIKSRLGMPATLLNASSATNFTYKITGISEEQISEINTIDTTSKIKDRLKAIFEAGGTITFHDIESNVFENNMRMIDTIMPEIMAEVLLAYFSGKGTALKDLISYLQEKDIQIPHINYRLIVFHIK